MSETRTLRDRQSAAAADLDRSAGGAPHGAAALLVATTTATLYPTSAGVAYACVPLGINGDEAEGAAATYVVMSANILFALNLGSSIPPNGANIVVHAVGGRWCFRWD